MVEGGYSEIRRYFSIFISSVRICCWDILFLTKRVGKLLCLRGVQPKKCENKLKCEHSDIQPLLCLINH